MKIRIVSMLALAAALSGASLLAVPHVTAQSPAQQLDDLTFVIGKTQTDLDVATKSLARTREQYKAGVISVSEVEAAQAKVDDLTAELEKAMRDRRSASLRAAFNSPVDIQLDHAKVQDFARVLSKASGVAIKVDPGVPADASTMLTMDAQAVPLAQVLQAIAEKTDLMIAPDGSGVILKKWPHLNGRIYRSATAPWSSEWGVPPTVSAGGLGGGGLGGGGLGGGSFGGGGGFGGGGAAPAQGGFFGGGLSGQRSFSGGGGGLAGGAQGQGGFGGGGGLNATPLGQGGLGGGGLNAGASGEGGFGGGGPVSPSDGMAPSGQAPFGGPGPGGMGMRPGLPFTMTNIGDHLIAIAEPGINNGVPGVWMTAYMFDSGGFHKMAQGFHPFANGPRGVSNAPAGNTSGRRAGVPAAKPSGSLPPATGISGGVPPASAVRPPQ